MAASPEDLGLKRKHKGPGSGEIHSKRKRQRQQSDKAQEQDFAQSDNHISHTLPPVKESEDENAAWTVSEPMGGKFIDRDPMFSKDEKLLIFATEHSVNTYSTSTSLLIQSLHSGDRGLITDYALSSIDSDVLWASTIEGHLLQWNFKTGEQLGSWKHATSIQSFKTVPDVDAKQETVFTIDPTASGWKVTAHRLGSESDPLALKQSTILESQTPISSLKALDLGNILAVTTLDSVILGNASTRSDGNLQDRRYTWREVKCKEPPVCFDIKLQTVDKQPVKSKKHKETPAPQTSSVNIVIGGVKGCIYVYEDVFNKLSRIENPSKVVEESSSFHAKAMHWHREAVGAVAWSKDGNYIISGGKETVLVLWQLDTGRKQFLPNLESPIQSIVVSHSGSSYAIRLGDNSVMVLSTSELSPTTYVAGLQSTSFSKVPQPQPQISTVESASQHKMESNFNRVAAVINPRAPNQLLAAVPAYQTARGANTSHSGASYIQNFDLSTWRHESRQAVARTNAISSNLGPEGNRILEPEVKFIQLSCDGSWLATIDEWSVPAQDINKLSAPGDSRAEYNETRLRFWSWDSAAKVWALNTRIENPHNDSYDDDAHSRSVLDLTSNPTATKFATLGTDSVVRVWAPRSATSKSKSGPTKGTTDEKAASETWWSVQHYISLEKSMSDNPLQSISPTRAILCYSNDASILSAYQFFEHDPSEGAVYLIDANDGILREIQRNFIADDDEIIGMAFLERYLICLGRDAAAVWDMTTFDMHAYISLDSKALQQLRLQDGGPKGKKKQKLQKHRDELMAHLAVNTSTSTFAIAVPESIDAELSVPIAHPLLGYQTRLLLFSPEQREKPIFSALLPRLTSALLPAGGLQRDKLIDAESTSHVKGYVVLDIGAEARIVAPAGFGSMALDEPNTENGHIEPRPAERIESPPAEMGVAEKEMLEDEDVSDDETDDALAIVTKALAAAMVKDEDTRPVVRGEQLAEVFDHPSHAMPPMQELFQGVLTLFAEKPTQMAHIQEVDNSTAIDLDSGSEEAQSESESDLESSSDED